MGNPNFKELPIDKLPGDPGVRYLPVSGWPGYAVGDDGSVWSCRQHKRWKRMSPTKSGDGYLYVELNNQQKRQRLGVHVLVAIHFIGPQPPGKPFVLHDPDQSPSNNSSGNLRWGSRRDNYDDSIERGKGKNNRSDKHKAAALTCEQAAEMRQLYASGATQDELARKFSVCQSLVNRVVRGRSYKDAAGQLTPVGRGRNRRCGQSHGMSRFTDDQVREMRRLHGEGRSIKSIARQFGSRDSTVGPIIHRQTWKHIA